MILISFVTYNTGVLRIIAYYKIPAFNDECLVYNT